MQKFCPQCGNTHEERGMMCSAEWKIADLQREIEKLATVDQVS